MEKQNHEDHLRGKGYNMKLAYVHTVLFLFGGLLRLLRRGFLRRHGFFTPFQ
jgi:hypothetical protein